VASVEEEGEEVGLIYISIYICSFEKRSISFILLLDLNCVHAGW